jgi:hypothetical protein
MICPRMLHILAPKQNEREILCTMGVKFYAVANLGVCKTFSVSALQFI